MCATLNFLSCSFLADRMRDGTDSDEENEKPMARNWNKEDSGSISTRLGNHRRGVASSRGALQGGSVISKDTDSGWGRPNAEQHNGRISQYSSNRKALNPSSQTNFSRPPVLSYNDGGARYKEILYFNIHVVHE